METRNLVGWFAAAFFLGPQPAAAQEECPIAQIGLSCDAGVAGTCLSATCTETADGATTTRSCGACVELPANACSNPGQPCGDGGTCSPSGGGGGGGGSANGSYSFMIGYSEDICEPAAATGSDDDAATRGLLMGGSAGSDGAAATVNAGDAASSHSMSDSASGSGCALSDQAPNGGTSVFEGIALLGATAMCRRRRRNAP